MPIRNTARQMAIDPTTTGPGVMASAAPSAEYPQISCRNKGQISQIDMPVIDRRPLVRLATQTVRAEKTPRSSSGAG